MNNETKNLIRKKYERTDPNNPLGINSNAIETIIRFLDNSLSVCQDDSIKFFLSHFADINQAMEEFQIFSGSETGFFINGAALQFNGKEGDIAVGHEIGHALNAIKNRQSNKEKPWLAEIVFPSDFSNILSKAKSNCTSKDNVGSFKLYLKTTVLNKQGEKMEKPHSSEILCVSDILSAIFKTRDLWIDKLENVYLFPAYHSEFFDENLSETERLERIFDEIFANIFTLMANNAQKELDELTVFLGNDFMNLYYSEIQKAIESFKSKLNVDSYMPPNSL